MGVALLAKKNPDSFSPLAPEDLILKLKKDHDRHIDELKVRLERISFVSDNRGVEKEIWPLNRCCWNSY